MSMNRIAIRFFAPLMFWFVLSGGLITGLALILNHERDENKALRIENNRLAKEANECCDSKPDSLIYERNTK